LQSKLQSGSDLNAASIAKDMTGEVKNDTKTSRNDISGANENSTTPITIVVVFKAFFSFKNVCLACKDTCCILILRI